MLYTFKDGNLPRLNPPRHRKPPPQVFRKHRCRQSIPTRVRDPDRLVVTRHHHARGQGCKVFLLPDGHVLVHVAKNDGGHADALVLGGGRGDGLERAVEEVSAGVEGAGDEFLDASFGGLVD